MHEPTRASAPLCGAGGNRTYEVALDDTLSADDRSCTCSGDLVRVEGIYIPNVCVWILSRQPRFLYVYFVV